jgi:hypothetical protein
MSRYRRFLMLAAAVWTFAALDAASYGVQSCGPPPPAAPQRRTGGEYFPPLPLPATPLRRTEKKRSPRPPSLFAKVAYGRQEAGKGTKVQWPDWKTDPGDIDTLLEWVNSQLGINYGSIETDLSQFSYDPSDVPVLYVTGHNALSIDTAVAGKLRAYLQDGGFLVADACCGSQEFRDAFEKSMKAVFPDRPLRVLPPEHPLFSAFQDATKVTYLHLPGAATTEPLVKGIDIGCRTAVFYFPRDVSCGWSGHVHDTGERYDIESARKLGANLVTYVIADYQLGRYLSSAKVYYQSGEKTRDEFVFGQIVHDGDYDPSPSGVANLLEYVDKESSIHVQYKKVAVKPDSPDVFNFPLLYMVGHYDFTLSDAAVANLKRFLANGGILFAESCCGRKEFDAAFRREIARVIGPDGLKPISPDSPLYSSFNKIDKVAYSPYAREIVGSLDKPLLEGALVDGNLAVIYSPLALANGWEQFDHPYSRGYDSMSALKIGTNVLVYAMSH